MCSSDLEFAKRTLEQAGVKGVTLRPILSKEWNSPTERPAYSVLRHLSLELQGQDDMPSWEDALDQFLERLPRP